MAAAAALLVSSCAKEIAPSASEGNEATVSFTIGLEDVVATRAIGDGLKCDKLVYEVYDVNGEKISALSQTKENAFNDSLTETVTITLAKGQTYSFAFWAQNSACTAYTTTDLQRIEISYGDICNEEDRDAFFGNVDNITVKGNFEQKVTLKRPFAQLNLGVSDLADAGAAGIALDQVKVVVDQVAANLDARTGAVSGAQGPVTFNLADVINNQENAEKLVINKGIIIGDKEVKEFPWIAMNYLLVNDESANGAAKATTNVAFTISTKDSFTETAKSDIELASSNTPLQRNWRTNIIAKLTSVGEFQIIIDPIFDGDRDIVVDEENGEEAVEKVYGVKNADGTKSYETLEEAIKDGTTELDLAEGTYELDGMNVSSDLSIIGASKDVKVNVATNNMNSKTATFENVTVATPGTNYTGLHHSGAVTFNDCVIENTYWCYSGEAKTVFNNCTFKQTVPSLYNVWTYGSNVEFNNCVFECAGKSVLIYTEGGNRLETVSFKDCKFSASAPANDGKAAIEIDSSLDPVGNVIIENCTAEGFDLGSVSGNMLYNIKKGAEGENCNITVALADGVEYTAGAYQISNANGMFWFANEVNVNGNSFSGKTVKLMADIDLENKLWAPVGQTGQPARFEGTFDGNKKTISNLNVDELSENENFGAAGLFGWIEGKAVVKNLTIDGATVKGHHYVAGVVGYCYGKILYCTVKNAKISAIWSTVVENDESNAAEHPLGNNGDKAGAIAGYFPYNDASEITSCHAENCQIDAVRDAGILAGAARPAQVTGTYTNVTVSNNDSAPEWAIKNNTNIDSTNLVGRIL